MQYQKIKSSIIMQSLKSVSFLLKMGASKCHKCENVGLLTSMQSLNIFALYGSKRNWKASPSS